jgi:hypothetical protein
MNTMNTPTTYLSLSYETGWKLIHNGQPVTASNRTIEQCYAVADGMGLMVDEQYFDGDLQQFISPFHSNNDEAVELSRYQMAQDNGIEDRPDEVTITVEVSDEGWMYSVLSNGTEVDGGLCTTTYENALDMALDVAKELRKQQ